MVMLCFVLDLRSLSPSLLRDLKQSILQLANYYAVYSPIGQSERAKSKPFLDRIGLCYVSKNRMSCSDELKVAYCPQGNFNLRDFHHAVNNLPTDAFSPEFNNSGSLGCSDHKLPSLLNDQVLYSWGGCSTDVTKKVILISSYVIEKLDSVARKTLMDAADKCVSIEFVFLEQKSSCLVDVPEAINNFVKQIGDLENCSFRTYLPDAHVLFCLVKQWFKELKEDIEEPLQARFIFKINLTSTLDQICCNLCTSFNHIIDEFTSSQTCRCHGIPLNNIDRNDNRTFCPVTNDELGATDFIENSVKVGDHTILFMPSFHCCPKLQRVSSPIDFNVIERTNLGSLSEGVIFGASYIVTPSTLHDSDDMDKSELNIEIFKVLCSTLNSFDQGLVCSSNCNLETAKNTSFQCYYVLLPSENGLMLLRRLAGSEEILPAPDVSQYVCSTLPKDIENSVQASLLKMEVSDYNPVQHERGFHQKLNLLIKESLQLGAIPPKIKKVTSQPNSIQRDSLKEVLPSMAVDDVTIREEKEPMLDQKTGEIKSSACITEEWEQLIVKEVPRIRSPSCISKADVDQPILSLPQTNKQLDEKTSRILERLEGPRQLKRKVVSPIVPSHMTSDACAQTKKPLIPYGPSQSNDPGSTASQPIRPNFQRIKRRR